MPAFANIRRIKLLLLRFLEILRCIRSGTARNQIEIPKHLYTNVRRLTISKMGYCAYSVRKNWEH